MGPNTVIPTSVVRQDVLQRSSTPFVPSRSRSFEKCLALHINCMLWHLASEENLKCSSSLPTCQAQLILNKNACPSLWQPGSWEEKFYHRRAASDCPASTLMKNQHFHRDNSPCRWLLLSTSHLHSALCKSSPCPLSIRRVPACLWHRSHTERWQCPVLWDLAL